MKWNEIGIQERKLRKSSQGKMLKRGGENNSRETKGGKNLKKEGLVEKEKTAEMFSWDGFSVSALLTL